MLNIDLLPNKDIRVLASTTDISVSRIGEIILFDEAMSSRPPWYDLFISKSWNILTGINTKVPIGDEIIFYVDNYTLDKLVKLDKQEFYLALIQIDDSNKLQCALCGGCFIVGSERSDDLNSFSFKITECEMMYN